MRVKPFSAKPRFTLLAHKRGVRREKGATMVEFAISLSLLILILGAFFDIGLAVHNWMLLRTVTLEAARSIAVGLVTRPDCGAAKHYLLEKAAPRLRNQLGADVKSGELRWVVDYTRPDTDRDTDQPLTFPTLRVTGEFHVDCLFLCHVIPGGLPLSSTSESVVETERELDDSCAAFSIKS